jgi:hypothetical protein
MKERVVVPVALFAGRDCVFKLIGDALERCEIAAIGTHGHRDQVMKMRLIVGVRADLEGVFEDV